MKKLNLKTARAYHLIQAAKARARGYRTVKNLTTMIYLIGAKLDFRLPT